VIRLLHRFALGFAFVALVAVLSAKAVSYSLEPDFELRLPYHHRTWFEIDGASYVHRLPDGELRIHAEHVRPGHERIGYFRLGPSTFLELRGVALTCTRDGKRVWRATAARGELRTNSLGLEGEVVITEASKSRTLARATVSLTTGRLQR